jgi:hypothetical protein
VEWEMTEWTVDELQEANCGAFVAVAQGNVLKTDRLIRLRAPAGDGRVPVNVGKETETDKDKADDVSSVERGTTSAAAGRLAQRTMTLGDFYTRGPAANAPGTRNRPVVLVGKVGIFASFCFLFASFCFFCYCCFFIFSVLYLLFSSRPSQARPSHLRLYPPPLFSSFIFFYSSFPPFSRVSHMTLADLI